MSLYLYVVRVCTFETIHAYTGTLCAVRYVNMYEHSVYCYCVVPELEGDLLLTLSCKKLLIYTVTGRYIFKL